MRACTALTLALLACTTGWAQSLPKGSDGCDHSATNADWRECEGDRASRADKQLNELYTKVMAKLSPADQGALRDVERTWLLYRDGQCKAEAAQYQGGSLQPGIQAGCLAKEAELRIADLHAAYDGP